VTPFEKGGRRKRVSKYFLTAYKAAPKSPKAAPKSPKGDFKDKNF
jgi:hypothetical protein